ncbi:MAG: hypothetical protein R3C02_25900 [Planctomycetaceae bacterium]
MAKRCRDAFFGYADGSGRVKGESPPIESADVPDEGYPDGLIAQAAIQKLANLKIATVHAVCLLRRISFLCSAEVFRSLRPHVVAAVSKP